MVLPLYTNLEKLDWSLLEAASDLGANAWHRTVRILLPLTMPGIVAGSIVVFIPSLGSYVTPDTLGGAKVILLGNLIQQQFMTARDWPLWCSYRYDHDRHDDAGDRLLFPCAKPCGKSDLGWI